MASMRTEPRAVVSCRIFHRARTSMFIARLLRVDLMALMVFVTTAKSGVVERFE